MYMKYLFLGEGERKELGDSGAKWQNLPTLSQSTRECYLSVVNCKVIFDNASQHDSLNIKMKIPSSNYFASDNSYPVVAFLNTTDSKTFTLEHDNEISILTNDNLKSIEFVLEDNNGAVIAIDLDDSMEVMIKLDYIDQKAQTDQFILELPKRL
jgi:hypothetical protein